MCSEDIPRPWEFEVNPQRVNLFPELREFLQHSSECSGGVVRADSEHLLEHIVYTDLRRRLVGFADARCIGVRQLLQAFQA